MNLIPLFLASVTPLVLYVLWVGFQKAVIEPIAQQIILVGIEKFITPAWDALDEKLTLPGAFEEWTKQGRKWLYHQVLPEDAKLSLSPQQLADLLSILEKEFSVTKHQEKVNGR